MVASLPGTSQASVGCRVGKAVALLRSQDACEAVEGWVVAFPCSAAQPGMALALDTLAPGCNSSAEGEGSPVQEVSETGVVVVEEGTRGAGQVQCYSGYRDLV